MNSLSSSFLYWTPFEPQSTYRVAIADFWRTSHHVGKLALAGEGGGVHAHPPPFSQLPSRTYSCSVRSCWEGRYTPSTSYILRGSNWENNWRGFEGQGRAATEPERRGPGLLGEERSLNFIQFFNITSPPINCKDTKAKCRHLRNLPVKGLCRRCLICLRPPPMKS